MNIMIKRNREGSRRVRIIAAAVIAAFALILPKSDVLATTSLSVDSVSVNTTTGILSYEVSGSGENLTVILKYPGGSVQSGRECRSGDFSYGEYLASGGTGTYKWYVIYCKTNAEFNALQTSLGNNWDNLSTSTQGYGSSFSFKSGSFDYTAAPQRLAAPTISGVTLDANKYAVVSYNAVDNADGYMVYCESHKSGYETQYFNSYKVTETTYNVSGHTAGDNFDDMVIYVVAVSGDYTRYDNSVESAKVTIYADGHTQEGNSGGSSSSTENSSTESSSESSSSSSSSSDTSSESSTPAASAPAAPAMTATTSGGQSITSWNSLDNALKAAPLTGNKSDPVQVTLTGANATIPADTFKALSKSASPMHVLTGSGIGLTFSGGSGSRQDSLNVASRVQTNANGKTIAFSSNASLNTVTALHTTVPDNVKSVQLFFVINGRRLGLGTVPAVNGRVMFPIGVLGTYELAY